MKTNICYVRPCSWNRAFHWARCAVCDHDGRPACEGCLYNLAPLASMPIVALIASLICVVCPLTSSPPRLGLPLRRKTSFHVCGELKYWLKCSCKFAVSRLTDLQGAHDVHPVMQRCRDGRASFLPAAEHCGYGDGYS